ncbi:MAG: restriction endonuclease subunit S [Clostridium sp.]
MKCIEDEIPFELPEGWVWARFSAITINRDSERKPISSSQRTDVAKIYDYYGASGKIDKIDKYIFNERLLLIGEDGANLVTRSKPIAFFAEGQYWVNNHAHCIDATDKFILEYLCFYINAISLEKYVTGSAQPKMTQDNMHSILIPLPPYSEQKRMSQRLNEVMYTVDNIEIEKADISELASKAKAKILDLAIRGQLVPQNPDDEPASVLLERIRAEKEELIKQGKIKRDKKESIIFKGEDNSYYEKIGSEVHCIDAEIPFEIPETWEWLRLQNCCVKEIKRGKSPKYATESSNTLVFAQKCNTKYNGIDIGLAQYLDESTLGKYPTDEYMQDGDIVINSTGTGTLGRVGLYQSSDNIKSIDIVPDSHVTVIRSYDEIDSFYLYAFMKSNQSELEKKGEGSTNQKELKPVTLKEMFVPIPSTREQERILILSILVDTFSSRISLTMPPSPKPHNTACVLS